MVWYQQPVFSLVGAGRNGSHSPGIEEDRDELKVYVLTLPMCSQKIVNKFEPGFVDLLHADHVGVLTGYAYINYKVLTDIPTKSQREGEKEREREK